MTSIGQRDYFGGRIIAEGRAGLLRLQIVAYTPEQASLRVACYTDEPLFEDNDMQLAHEADLRRAAAHAYYTDKRVLLVVYFDGDDMPTACATAVLPEDLITTVLFPPYLPHGVPGGAPQGEPAEKGH